MDFPVQVNPNNFATKDDPNWIWDEITYPETPHLSARRAAAFAYVHIDDEPYLFLFGGRNGGSVLNDTWLFSLNNRTWIEVATNAPPPRLGMLTGYDPTNKRVIVVTGRSTVPSGSSSPSELYDVASPWVFDLETFSWSQMPCTVGRRSITKIPPAVARAFGGVDVSLERPSRLMVAGGWDYTGVAVQHITMITLGRNSFEWHTLSMPRYRPFPGLNFDWPPPNPDPEDNDYASVRALTQWLKPGTGYQSKLLLMGGSSGWVDKDGHRLYYFGGCIYEPREVKQYYVLGSTEADEEGGCSMRNVVKIEYQVDFNAETAGNSTFADGEWTIYPDRCVGARQMGSMVSLLKPDNTYFEDLVIYAGRGSFQWGDGIRGSIGLINTVDGIFRQILPGISNNARNQGYSYYPVIREGEMMISVPYRFSRSASPNPFEGTAIMMGGYGDNELYLSRIWVLKNNYHNIHATSMQAIPCNIQTVPVLALSGTFVTTRLVVLHGVFIYIVIAVLMSVDILSLFSVLSKRWKLSRECKITQSEECTRDLQDQVNLKYRDWLVTHQRMSLIAFLSMLMSVFFAILAIYFAGGSFDTFHVVLGLVVCACSTWLALSGLAISFWFKESKSATLPSPISGTKTDTHIVCLIKVTHAVVGYIVYLLSFVTLVLIIGHALPGIQQFYMLTTAAVICIIAVVFLHRRGILRKFFPGYDLTARRIFRLWNQYAEKFQSVSPKPSPSSSLGNSRSHLIEPIESSVTDSSNAEQETAHQKLYPVNTNSGRDQLVEEPDLGPSSPSLGMIRVLTTDSDTSEHRNTFRSRGGRFAPINRILGSKPFLKKPRSFLPTLAATFGVGPATTSLDSSKDLSVQRHRAKSVDSVKGFAPIHRYYYFEDDPTVPKEENTLRVTNVTETPHEDSL